MERVITKWEYKVLNGYAGIESSLNELGQKGWELIQIYQYSEPEFSGITHFVFKKKTVKTD